jgi:ubiquinone/menaquinone biosynthesis C-methylase UbiE
MKQLLLVLLSLLPVFTAPGQDQWRNVYRESAWEQRDSWQKPADLIKLLGVKEGSTVADVGCNEGYMTIKLAKATADNGKVYAVDVNQLKLNRLKDHLDDRNIKNVIRVKGDYDNPKLPENTLDAVIILDTYHEMDDHDEILKHLGLALKRGGRLLLCEPIAESRRNMKRSEQKQKHELSINYAIEDLAKAGFEIKFKKDPFIDRSKVKGDMMWVIVAVKK